MRGPIAILLSILSMGATAAGAAEAPQPLTARDMHAMQRISDPRPSPDGRQIAYVLRTTDFAANRGRFDLWLVGIDGSGATRLTSHDAADTEPRWAPDGKSLYFLSSRSGSNQVWRMPVPGGEKDAVQVTDLPLDVANLLLSPGGTHVAFSLEVFPDCPTLACTVDRLAAHEKRTTSARVYDGGFYRHWDTWSDGRRNHVFVAPIVAENGAGKIGQPVDLSKGMWADVPSRPFGGSEEWAFAPDGKTLVFAARLAGEKNREEPWSTDLDLYQAALDGSGEPRNLTDANPATDTQPVFSPDGRTLAYLKMMRPGFEADRLRIVVRDMASGQERVLAEEWDRSSDGVVFSPDGKTLYTTAFDIGQAPLFAIDLAGGGARKLVADGHVRDLRVAGDRLVFGRDHMRSPVELHTAKLDGSDVRQITRVNREKLASVLFGEPEQFSFQGANGDTVYAWITKPVPFDPQKKYPIAYIIHGGPQGSSHNEFHYRWNPQTYAAAGYAAIQVDFHGSLGYGQAFTDAIRQDWGGKPLEDLQKGLAASLQRYPWLDGDRACALGASYGGYMIAWIASQWPDAFRCLVNHDGTFDQRMMYFGTEETWFPEWEHGGPYWSHEADHERQNPVRFVDRWKTPMLVIHGGLDFRIPDNQGIGAFNALQRRGVPSRFVHFPDENHWVLKPGNSIFWHEAVLGWLGQWLKNEPAPAAN